MMKIVLLADKEQKEELMAQRHDMPAELIWLREPDLTGIMTGADVCIDLLFDNTEERTKKLNQFQAAFIIINSATKSLAEPGFNAVRINGWNTFLKRPIIEAAGDDGLKKKAGEVFSFFNKTPEWTPDVTGFISLRVVVSIINEAFFALEQGVSTKEEIDTAMKLGTNYPYGPFEWSEKIGLKNIYLLLSCLAKEQERYEPAALLAKEATV